MAVILRICLVKMRRSLQTKHLFSRSEWVFFFLPLFSFSILCCAVSTRFVSAVSIILSDSCSDFVHQQGVKVQVKIDFSKEAQPGRGAKNYLRKEVITIKCYFFNDLPNWHLDSFVQLGSCIFLLIHMLAKCHIFPFLFCWTVGSIKRFIVFSLQNFHLLDPLCLRIWNGIAFSVQWEVAEHTLCFSEFSWKCFFCYPVLH